MTQHDRRVCTHLTSLQLLPAKAAPSRLSVHETLPSLSKVSISSRKKEARSKETKTQSMQSSPDVTQRPKLQMPEESSNSGDAPLISFCHRILIELLRHLLSSEPEWRKQEVDGYSVMNKRVCDMVALHDCEKLVANQVDKLACVVRTVRSNIDQHITIDRGCSLRQRVSVTFNQGVVSRQSVEWMVCGCEFSMYIFQYSLQKQHQQVPRTEEPNCPWISVWNIDSFDTGPRDSLVMETCQRDRRWFRTDAGISTCEVLTCTQTSCGIKMIAATMICCQNFHHYQKQSIKRSSEVVREKKRQERT